MFGEEILQEIDATLDQLICNAESIQNVDLADLKEIERDAFQKTQESLMQRLMHMDALFAQKREMQKSVHPRSSSMKIQEKLLKFEKLKSHCDRKFAKTQKKQKLLLKRRQKRFLKTDANL